MKQPNGFAGHSRNSSISDLKGLPPPPRFPQFINILRGLIPYILFLFFYGINGQIHLLPRFDDIDCITLHNISAFEQFVFHFQTHKLISSLSSPVLDILSAVPYLCHYVIPVLYPLFLYCKGRIDDVPKFYWLLGWVMWAHYTVWFLLPTAPPWLYANAEQYKQANMTIPPLPDQHKEGCAFGRLDAMTGIPFFFNMFKGNPIPFGSFPSGHVAWPTCIYLTLPPGGRFFLLYIVWMAWATMYSCHHYVSDAIAAVILVICVKKSIGYLSDRATRTRESSCTLPSVVCPLQMV